MLTTSEQELFSLIPPIKNSKEEGEIMKSTTKFKAIASATITLTVYQHVHPGMGREAADRFAALLEG